MVTEPRAEVIEGRYELGPVIGRGAMGEVRRGWDTRLEREVAVKCLRRDLAADDGVRVRFEDEARSAARLNHPAIVAVYDSGEWNKVPYLVMECLPGRTLAEELAQGRVAPGRVRDIAVELLGALAAAHRLGVIHRDVKPGNVLLTTDGFVKLADFGIAKSTDTLDHTQTGLIIGTPAYLAPERLEGRAATAQSDLYALGVVLYEALTGERPFHGDTPVALAHAIHATTPLPIRERLPEIDPALARVIDAAMAKDPARRPASAEAMLALLAGRIDPLPETQPIPTTAARPLDTTIEPTGAARRGRGRTHPHRPQLSVLVMAALAVLVAIVLVSAARGRSDTPPPTTTSVPAAEPPLPAPLDDAITKLEESVTP